MVGSIKELCFVTTNSRKIKSLEGYLKKNKVDISVKSSPLLIIEPQSDTVKEVSKIKALEAYKELQVPVVVEDGGFCIDALKGFPGVYSKYILDTIGVEGILKLMEGQENRKCGFISTTTYVDEEGAVYQFDRLGGNGELLRQRIDTKSNFAWSDFWYIFYIPSLKKTLAECSEDELINLWSSPEQKSSLEIFAEWFSMKH